MKAAAVGENGVVVADIDVPRPKPNEVLVKVRACGLNRADIMVASGLAHGRTGGVGTVIGLEWSGAWQKYLRGLLVGLVMFVAAIGISAAFGYIAVEEVDPQQQGLAALGGVLLVFLGRTVQGPAEEALTRGWLLPVIGARYRPLLGVIISSAILSLLFSLSLVALRSIRNNAYNLKRYQILELM